MIALLIALMAVAPTPGSPQETPAIDSQVVFLYYEDVDAAAAFYGETLGLEMTFDRGWVRIFATGPRSFVGLVDSARGTHRASDDKPVMLSLVTPDPDGWHRRLVEAGVEIVSPPADSSNVPVRAFLARDPGGYTVEFFRWNEGS